MGSIPACAGEPQGGLRPPCTKWVYPRVCGGTSACHARCTRATGLSPRVRGNLPDTQHPQAGNRSIPACAGEPLPSSIAMASCRVYPRVCGEPYDAARIPCRRTVYPRVCGGTSAREAWRGTEPGLSPRVRGNPLGWGLSFGLPRSIPACAGEPCGEQILPNDGWVYPRVCGGTLRGRGLGRPEDGLSPRVRGNLRTTSCMTERDGSIPACAGEPRTARTRGAY